MCLLQGTGSHVSDVAHGPLVFFLLRLRCTSRCICIYFKINCLYLIRVSSLNTHTYSKYSFSTYNARTILLEQQIYIMYFVSKITENTK